MEAINVTMTMAAGVALGNSPGVMFTCRDHAHDGAAQNGVVLIQVRLRRRRARPVTCACEAAVCSGVAPSCDLGGGELACRDLRA